VSTTTPLDLDDGQPRSAHAEDEPTAASRAGRALADQRWQPTAHVRATRRAEDIVRHWPTLNESQRATVRAILAPVVSDDLASPDEAA
jgi:hypothetical protein